MSQHTNLLKAWQIGSHLSVERRYHPLRQRSKKNSLKTGSIFVKSSGLSEIAAPITTIRYLLYPFVIISGVSSTVTWGNTILDNPPAGSLFSNNEGLELVAEWQDYIPSGVSQSLYLWIVEFHPQPPGDSVFWPQFDDLVWESPTTTFHFGKKTHHQKVTSRIARASSGSLISLRCEVPRFKTISEMPWRSDVRPSQTIKTGWLPLK